MDLSVIISVSSMQHHIAACLRSITRCPCDTIDMECVVVNDKSTDEIAAIVNRYIERDSRIKLVTREGDESFDARNMGIEKASGRYILFLDARDRLCEDAWEQIEAAVVEEYADFVAFSYITARENGKLKAQMLPISDVISTDVKVARRLMYAGAAFDTYWGKLFKSSIIRDNNILFQTDLPGSDSLLFVAEYFEHCDSYLMTKAMILYHAPNAESAMRNYSMEERVEFVRALYEINLDMVKHYNDSELIGHMQVYYVKVLTELFYAYVKEYSYSKRALETIYEKALENAYLKRILEEVDERMIPSGIRKYEYRLLRRGNAAKLRKYFSIKAMVQKG
ncbi:MAG: glycosyltransferase family 2 protein [Lachnospiraceae bacterium]|nr:glycosyltransferase family 2 protein [Lachnospiraceae bacterium]